jgi:hypothetical protein
MPSLATNPRSASQRRGRRECEREEKWIETKEAREIDEWIWRRGIFNFLSL